MAMPPLPSGFQIVSSAPQRLPPVPNGFVVQPAGEVHNSVGRFPAPKQSSGWGRELGLGTRNVATGITDFLGIVGNPINYAVSKVTGQPYQTMSNATDQLLDQAGLARPETTGERVSSDISRAVIGSGGLSGTGRVLIPAAGKLGLFAKGLASNPVLQASSAVTGAGAASTVRELGGGPVPQLVAGLAGGLIPGSAISASRAAGSAGRVLRDRYSAPGAERRAGRVLLSEAESPGSISVADESKIPGYNRSLASQTEDAGLFRLERQARNDGQGWTEIDKANNAAHIKSITGFAGDEESLARLTSARSAAADPLREVALRARGIDSGRVIRTLRAEIKRNEGRKSILPALEGLVVDFTRKIPTSERKREALAVLDAYVTTGRKSSADLDAAKQAMMQIRRGESPTGSLSSKSGQDALREASKKFHGMTAPEDRVLVLDNVRKTIGDMLSGKFGGDSAQALAGSAELMKVKASLDKALYHQSPEYQQYLDIFRGMSKPTNRQQVGQYLISPKSGGAVTDNMGNQQLTPASFTRLARDLDTTAARATGFDKAKIGKILEPEDRAIIDNVVEDLRRRSDVSTKGSGGNSLTSQFNNTRERTMASAVDSIPWIGGVTRYFGSIGDKRMSYALNQMQQNPSKARVIIRSLRESDQVLLARAIKIQDHSTMGSASRSAMLGAREEDNR